MVNRQVIEWDKDDIDTLRFMKVDVLGLGMLGCMRRAFDLLAEHKGQGLDLATIPPRTRHLCDDPQSRHAGNVSDRIAGPDVDAAAAEATHVLRYRYSGGDRQAGADPGRHGASVSAPAGRSGESRVSNPELRRVLEKTLGVPLFQEQAMQVAIVCAGFTPSEADALRRSMATFKFTGGVSHFKEKLIAGMVERGYTAEFAEKTFSQIEGFGSYGFPESHAASFALIAYASSWLKCHHPDVFCCALLNAQPMGFYATAQIVRDAGIAWRGGAARSR